MLIFQFVELQKSWKLGHLGVKIPFKSEEFPLKVKNS